jgi:hypothetical protein
MTKRKAKMNSDLLDEYCEAEFGHTDWAMDWDADGNLVITFHKEPRPDYLEEQEEEDEDETPHEFSTTGKFTVEEGLAPTRIRMRRDLAREGISIPAGLSYKDYDDLQDVIYLTDEEMEGAVEYDTGEDPDSHAFCPAKLKDGRIVYFIGVDLEWFDEEEKV